MTDSAPERQGTELRNLYRGALFVTAGALAFAAQGFWPAVPSGGYPGDPLFLQILYFGPGLAMLGAAIAVPARPAPGGVRIVLTLAAAVWSVLVAWLLLSFRAAGLA
jgi:hypothetical protein